MLLKEFMVNTKELTKDENMRFVDSTYCVTTLFESFFKPFKTEKSWKVIINATGEKKYTSEVIDSDIFELYKIFNFKKFFKACNNEKKMMIAEFFFQGLLKAVEINGWPKSNFEEAYKACLEHDLYNAYYLKKIKASPNKMFKARIYCEHETDFFKFFLELENKLDKTTDTIFIASCRPNPFLYTDFVRDFKWKSNTEIEFYSDEGTLLKKIDLLKIVET